MQAVSSEKEAGLTNRWTSRLRICLDRPNVFTIVGVVPADAAALVNSMLDPDRTFAIVRIH